MDRNRELSGDQRRDNTASGTWPLASGGSRDVADVEQDSVVHSDHPIATRIYRGLVANDNSRLHAGDVHNYNWYLGSTNTESNTDSPEAKLQRLRSALSYPQM